ncbi:hypothetical protein BDW74DRAFT_158700 [Aspergillus multicolor]|uniref:uncharacterized protein n=1 Tax=Aspergillus multicolor TaxID=41759 RepID=UPI003CCCC9CD
MTISIEAIVGIVALPLAVIPIIIAAVKYWRKRKRNHAEARGRVSQQTILPMWCLRNDPRKAGRQGSFHIMQASSTTFLPQIPGRYYISRSSGDNYLVLVMVVNRQSLYTIGSLVQPGDDVSQA